jgi:hypothetical protein
VFSIRLHDDIFFREEKAAGRSVLHWGGRNNHGSWQTSAYARQVEPRYMYTIPSLPYVLFFLVFPTWFRIRRIQYFTSIRSAEQWSSLFFSPFCNKSRRWIQKDISVGSKIIIEKEVQDQWQISFFLQFYCCWILDPGDPDQCGSVKVVSRENISRGPTFGDFVTILIERSMQDGCKVPGDFYGHWYYKRNCTVLLCT